MRFRYLAAQQVLRTVGVYLRGCQTRQWLFKGSSEHCKQSSTRQTTVFQIFFIFVCAILKAGESIRDTPAGQFLRLLGFRSWLYYPEGLPGYQPPDLLVVSEPQTVQAVRDRDELEKTSSRASAVTGAPQSEMSRRLSEKGLSEALEVTWLGRGDPNNPRDRSDLKKSWIIVVISLHSFVVCMLSLPMMIL